MSPLIVLIGTTIMLVNLVVYVGFSIASIILIGYCMFEKNKTKDVKKNNIVPMRRVVRKRHPLVGAPTWKRINGRLVKKYYIVDIENDSYGYAPPMKELKKVKKKLQFSTWDRVDGRLVRTGF